MPWSRVEAWEVFIQIKAKTGDAKYSKTTNKIVNFLWIKSSLTTFLLVPAGYKGGERSLNVRRGCKRAVANNDMMATKTSLKKWICASASNLTALIPSRSIRQMLATVSSWSWILKDCIKVQEKKKKVVVLCSCPPQKMKLGSFTS